MLFIFIILCATLPYTASTVVKTYTNEMYCKGCGEWIAMIEQEKAHFPTMQFETVEFDFNWDAPSVTLPLTKYGNLTYDLPQTRDFLHRWLLDISNGQNTVLVRNTSAAVNWHWMYDTWIHVLSATYPHTLALYARTLPSVAFAWTFMNTSRATAMYKKMDGTIGTSYDVHDLNGVIRRLLPPLIPFDEAESRAGRQILQYFDDSIYVVAPSVPAYNLPNVAFVHMTGEEDHAVRYNMTAPSAWLWKRNVEFMLPNVDVESVYRWYYGIQYGSEPPFQRLSLAKEGDLSGDEVWDWVRAREHAFIFEYASDETLSSCRAAVSDMTYDVGQLDMRTNDHESFPEWSRPGMIHYYRSGSYVGTRSCADAHTFLPKEEL